MRLKDLLIIQGTGALNPSMRVVHPCRAAACYGGLPIQFGGELPGDGSFGQARSWGLFFSDAAVVPPREDLVTMRTRERAAGKRDPAARDYRQKVLSWAPETATGQSRPGRRPHWLTDSSLGEPAPVLSRSTPNAGELF